MAERLNVRKLSELRRVLRWVKFRSLLREFVPAEAIPKKHSPLMDIGEYLDEISVPASAELAGHVSADYLVLPRSVLQSMPRHWQYWLVSLLKHCDATVAWSRGNGYRVARIGKGGKFIPDPYGWWKSVGGELRQLPVWDEVSGVSVDPAGEHHFVTRPRKPVLIWRGDELVNDPSGRDLQAILLDQPERALRP